MTKMIIDVSLPLRRRRKHRDGSVMVVGEGTKHADQIVGLGERALAKVKAGKVRIRRKPRRKPMRTLGDVREAVEPSGFLGFNKPGKSDDPEEKKPSADYTAVVRGAQSIADRLRASRFDDADNTHFARHQAASNWALAGMKGYGDAFKDHHGTVVDFRRVFNQSLPPILQELVDQHPNVPVDALVDAAVELLLKEAGQLFEVLGLYTLVIEQYRNGDNLRMLNALNTVMTSLFHVSQGYDLDKLCAGIPHEPLLPLTFFHAGDKIVSGLLGRGLGVIPAGKVKGALGVHLLLFQRDMQTWFAEALGLLPHEDEHNVDNDIPGFLDEASKVMFQRVQHAIESKQVKVSDTHLDFAGSMIPTADALAKLSVDLLQENGADAGAIRKIGRSFFRSMASSFPALSIRQGNIADAKRKLRTSSQFMLRKLRSGKFALVFEPHTPDYARVQWVAHHLKAMGRGEDFESHLALARELVGPIPSHITWGPASEKYGVDPIKIPTGDIEAIMPVVSDVLMNHKFKTLGGRSKLEIVNFYGGEDPMRRQRRVDEASAGLKQGLVKPPKGMKVTEVIAAAADNFYEAMMEGKDKAYTAKLQDNIIEMIEVVRDECPGGSK